MKRDEAAKHNAHTEPSAKGEDRSAKADDIERLKDEAKQATDQYLRALAEFENTKKRLSREKTEFVRYASETVVRELLPIVDSLDQALVAVDKQSETPAPAGMSDAPGQAVIKGVHLIYRQLLGVLEKEGVVRIATVGESFDPHRHEAVAEVDAGDGRADETIVEEVQVGYTMHGRVIRPAMVKVAKQTAHSTPRPAAADRRGGQHTADSKTQTEEEHTPEDTQREEEVE